MYGVQKTNKSKLDFFVFNFYVTFVGYVNIKIKNVLIVWGNGKDGTGATVHTSDQDT